MDIEKHCEHCGFIFEGTPSAFHFVDEPLYFCKATEEKREESHFLAWLKEKPSYEKRRLQ